MTSELVLQLFIKPLTHWGRVTHICVSNLTTIGSDNGLSPERHLAIICTNAGILLIGPLGTNFIEILVEIQIFSFMKMHLKMSSAKWRPFCLCLNVLSHIITTVLFEAIHTHACKPNAVDTYAYLQTNIVDTVTIQPTY